VWLKNRTQTSYFEKDKKTSTVREEPMAASDCAAIKSSILPLLAASPTRAITLQLGTILKIVVQRDFPDRWPGLLQEVKAMLGSGNLGQVGAGCVAALECVRAFRRVVTLVDDAKLVG
jgi:importin-7